MRSGLCGSSRHSRTFRSITTAPGIAPSRSRCSTGRVSTTSAPPATSPSSWSTVTRSRRARASASSSSIDRGMAHYLLLMSDIEITHNEAARRYELRVGSEVASVADYQPDGAVWVFDHTETDPRFRGRGLAAKLVRWALDDVKGRGVKIVPTCCFVADFVEAHAEYASLVA